MSSFADLMVSKGWSVYKLADASNVPKSTVGDLRSGRTEWKSISVETAYKLSRALGMTITEVYEYLRDGHKYSAGDKLKEIDTDTVIEILSIDDGYYIYNVEGEQYKVLCKLIDELQTLKKEV